MEYMPYIWIAIALVMGIIEASTAQLVSVWFVIGGLAAAVSCIFTDNVFIQIAVFLIVSFASLLATRPFVKKITKFGRVKTNLDSTVGKTAVVTSDIDNRISEGAVTVGGKVWTARSVDGKVIPKNSNVKVISIEGVKLIVEKI